MQEATIGIIGGTGLGDVLLKEAGGRAVDVDTPFGPPSSAPILAEWEGMPVAFLARHGEGHRFNPSKIPYRANIWALKNLGVSRILASGATGSLREDIQPGHLVLCDQLIDKTVGRDSTFFDDGPVTHVEFSDPFCPHLRSILADLATDIPTTLHPKGTYVCMEGPQFSTRAESNMHRLWGGDLIGMTCLPEAKLAREAEMCYALIALPTDYDCWRPVKTNRPGDELLREILGNLEKATQNAMTLIRAAVKALSETPDDPSANAPPCRCRDALKLAIWSDKAGISADTRKRLEPFLSRHLAD